MAATSTSAAVIIAVAVIGLVQVIAIPLVNGWILAGKERRDAEARRTEKEEDWRRQDEVASRLLKAQQAAVTLAAAMSDKLDQGLEQGRKIHILVNSDMTAARTAERDAAARLVVLMKQVRAANILAGIPVMELDREIKIGEARVVELNEILADRLAAQQKVDSENGGQK